MEVSLTHAEVDQRADELARLYLLRDKVATRLANVRAKLKKQHDDELDAMDERIEKLAHAVRDQREDTDAQLSIAFVASDPSASPDDLAENVGGPDDADPDRAPSEGPDGEDQRPAPETIEESIARDREASRVAGSNEEAAGTFVDQLREQDGKPARKKGKLAKKRPAEARA